MTKIPIHTAGRRRWRPSTDQVLIGLIIVLTLWGIGVQILVRSYVRKERSLTSGDEDRLAEEIATIEHELVQQFTPQQLDVWAAEPGDADDQIRQPEAGGADPNVPNANGEFVVSNMLTRHVDGGPDVLLASRLLFPVVDGDWCELKMTRTIAPGSYMLSMTGVLGRWGAQAAAGLLLLQVRVAGQWSPLLGTPRARAEDVEAPLQHNFSVSHRFDGVRLLACAGGGLEPRRDLQIRPPALPGTPGEGRAFTARRGSHPPLWP